MQETEEMFEDAFKRVIEIGNHLAKDEKDVEIDTWNVADGLLAGAIQFWLFSRQPCGDPRCEDCEPVSTSQGRLATLKKLVHEYAEESEYFHTPTDSNVGRA